jgi:arylsulfatase A-like enzyme
VTDWEEGRSSGSIVTARYVREAIGFIDRSVAAGRPICLNLWPDDLHSPFFPTKELRGQGGKRALYQAVLQTMGVQLKPLFDRVNGDPRLRGNTLILTASDNGPEAGVGTAEGLRGSKGELWEGGIRSPLIAWGRGLMGGKISGRVNRTTTISAVDLAVSLGSFSGSASLGEVPVDGENLLAALLGISEAKRSRPLFWRRPPDRLGTPESPLPDLAVRDGEWKLLFRLDEKDPMLFNIKSDPGETVDLALARVPLTKRLTESVLQWNKGLPENATSDRFSTSTRR